MEMKMKMKMEMEMEIKMEMKNLMQTFSAMFYFKQLCLSLNNAFLDFHDMIKLYNIIFLMLNVINAQAKKIYILLVLTKIDLILNFIFSNVIKFSRKC
jgi:hypothetical protein